MKYKCKICKKKNVECKIMLNTLQKKRFCKILMYNAKQLIQMEKTTAKILNAEHM